MSWKLNRTAQCTGCPWIVGVNPRDIPGYCESMHRDLSRTIADAGAMPVPGAGISAMACHESPAGDETPCVGWLAHQAGPGNNIAMRLRLMSCENAGQIRLRGPQHQRFEDTLPTAEKETSHP